ncbi:MAG: glycerophosphodiester phosphodiesterase [Nitrospiria bacterium]
MNFNAFCIVYDKIQKMVLLPLKKLARKTLIIAHRGASGYAPENTLASFEYALKLKAQMIELDIQLSSDDHWIVMHDATLKRTCGLSKKVSLTPLSTLKTLDAGSWFSKDYSEERIMTIEELLSWARNKISLNIEIKGKLKKGSNSLLTLLKIIDDYKMTKNVILSCFNWNVLREIRLFNRTLPVGLLVNRQPEFIFLAKAIDLKAFSIHLPKHKMRAELGKKIHQRDMKVYLYTLNQLNDIRKYLKMGVDGVFTNYPDLLSAKLVEEIS